MFARYQIALTPYTQHTLELNDIVTSIISENRFESFENLTCFQEFYFDTCRTQCNLTELSANVRRIFTKYREN